MAITFKAYFIQCITNLHAGSGDANYGVVDKLVQRDPVTGHPTVHASSLKGGLREHFEVKWGKGDSRVESIFGKESKGKNESETGDFKFLGADLLSLPVRCNFNQYVMALNGKQAESINSKAELLIKSNIFTDITSSNTLYYQVNQPGYEVYAEDIKISEKINYINPLIKTPSGFKSLKTVYAAFIDEDFKSISKNLPVIARNNIENGKSTNLWYEEVVPHQSIFICYIAYDDAHSNKDEFEKLIAEDVIQIGANATVGYGLCKFYKL